VRRTQRIEVEPLRERIESGLVFGGVFAAYGAAILLVMFLAAGLTEGTPEIRIRGGLLRLDLALLL
jgi:hypothetical protein